MKILVATYHRASDGALSKLIQKMKDEDLYTEYYEEADWILIPGDREESFGMALKAFKDNKKMIHLWAGEYTPTWETHNDVYRHAITLMSHIQLCTNDEAKERVKALCKSVGKQFFVTVVGNVMLDNMEDIDESDVPEEEYDLVLYNPPSRLSEEKVEKDISIIKSVVNKNHIWLPPNGDLHSHLVMPHVNSENLPRPKFLGLLKNCKRYLSNSSNIYYEATHLLEENQIAVIGLRNKFRESRTGNMRIPNASKNIMMVLRQLINE